MSLLAQAPPVDLGTLQPPTSAFVPTGVTPAATVAPLGEFMSTFIGFLTTLAGLMFLIYFIFAALSWITAGGEKGRVENAKNQMTNAALGLVIVIAAYSIAGIVGGVFGLDVLNPGKLLLKLVP